jgi:hypothetical protein
MVRLAHLSSRNPPLMLSSRTVVSPSRDQASSQVKLSSLEAIVVGYTVGYDTLCRMHQPGRTRFGQA